MLSNCKKCKYYGDCGCAVNPHYWLAVNKLKALSPTSRALIEPLIEPCLEWDELAEDALIITPATSLSFAARLDADGERQRQSHQLLQQILADCTCTRSELFGLIIFGLATISNVAIWIWPQFVDSFFLGCFLSMVVVFYVFTRN